MDTMLISIDTELPDTNIDPLYTGWVKKNGLCLRVQKIRSMASVAYSFHRSSILHLNSGFWRLQLQQISLSVIPVGIKSSPKNGLFISKFNCYVEFHVYLNAQNDNETFSY